MKSFLLNLPLILTLIRLVISPLLLPFLFYYFLPEQSLEINIFLALIFLILSFTDFLDGYIARRFSLETTIGRLLDPIADKFLLLSVLIVLVYIQKIFFYWALILIAREIFVLGLREISSSYGFNLKVLSSAKIKTLFQVIYITFVIINPYSSLGFNANIYNILENIILFLCLYFSIFSAYKYWTIFYKNFKELNEI